MTVPLDRIRASTKEIEPISSLLSPKIVQDQSPNGFHSLSIVIPVYNEQATIREVIDKVLAVNLPLKKEIIVSDDGSSDASVEIIEQQRSIHKDVIRKVHSAAINLGKGAAIRQGFCFATGDIIIIQDADLELDPNEYGALIQPIMNHEADVVYGSRFRNNRNNVTLKTRLANGFLTALTNLLFGGQLTDMETAYKVFRADVLDNIRLRCVGFDIEPEITAKVLLAGYTIKEVPIAYTPRTHNEGKKISWRDGVDALYILLKCKFL